jgi:hypothetical protein
VAGLLHQLFDDVYVANYGNNRMKSILKILAFSCSMALAPICVSAEQKDKATWKSVEFAIVKVNDEAPKSWNLYHTEKKGLLLLHLWKRYLLIDMNEEEAYEIDPQTVKAAGEKVEWSLSEKPEQPLDTPEWKSRDIGPMQRTRFRLGKNGSFLELQIPLQINGKPLY